MEVPYQEIRSIVEGVVAPSPSRSDTLRFAHLTYGLACSYLLTRGSTEIGKNHESRDLSQDMMADLFEREGTAGFPRISRYYEGVEWYLRSDMELWCGTRRLVAQWIETLEYRIIVRPAIITYEWRDVFLQHARSRR